MAQTPTCLLDGGPYKPPFGDCAIYSESTVCLFRGLFCLSLGMYKILPPSTPHTSGLQNQNDRLGLDAEVLSCKRFEDRRLVLSLVLFQAFFAGCNQSQEPRYQLTNMVSDEGARAVRTVDLLESLVSGRLEPISMVEAYLCKGLIDPH